MPLVSHKPVRDAAIARQVLADLHKTSASPELINAAEQRLPADNGNPSGVSPPEAPSSAQQASVAQ